MYNDRSIGRAASGMDDVVRLGKVRFPFKEEEARR
jgi:hypothetical protein